MLTDFTRQTISVSVRDKGERLYHTGMVAHGPEDREYRVKGDHGWYRVKVHSVSPFGVIGECDCPARKACSHLYAATMFGVANDGLDQPKPDVDPFDIR